MQIQEKEDVKEMIVEKETDQEFYKIALRKDDNVVSFSNWMKIWIKSILFFIFCDHSLKSYAININV